MKIFFDSEFTGLQKNTTLISIGLIDENNRMFYGVFDDCDESQLNDWLIENIINKLDYELPETLKDSELTYVKGDKTKIRLELLDWLNEGGYNIVEFVSDVCHYDFVLLIDLLWDCALSLPDNVSPVCVDINSHIARYKNITDFGAFGLSREKLIKSDLQYNKKDTLLVEDLLSLESKHNALYDAIVIKLICEGIENNHE